MPQTGTERKSSACRASLLSQKVVLWRKSEALTDYFTLGKELGRGYFGVVYECRDNVTGELFACKAVSKQKLKTTDDENEIRREVMIMHTLLGVENCVQLKVTFEDAWFVYLVMELCSGGELFERISELGRYTESNAAKSFRAILKVIVACHSMGIIHRDLKPENFLLKDKSEDATLKVADFGLSTFFKEREVFTTVAGTLDYMAPEVLAGSYGPEADMWAAGIILYYLLSGQLPWGENDRLIYENIMRNRPNFSSALWKTTSAGAMDILARCMDRNPKRRITAEEALQHEWVREDGGAPDTAMDVEVLARMRNFAGMERLKKLGLMLLVRHLNKEEIEGLRQLFLQMDTDQSGTITLDELVVGLERHGAHMARSDVSSLMTTMDVQGDGTLDYEEFLAATVHFSKVVSEENLFNAFAELDADGSGFVTSEEIATKLSEVGASAVSPDEVRRLIGEADLNDDGMIDYLEFLNLMAPGLRTPHKSADDATANYKARLANSKSNLSTLATAEASCSTSVDAHSGIQDYPYMDRGSGPFEKRVATHGDLPPQLGSASVVGSTSGRSSVRDGASRKPTIAVVRLQDEGGLPLQAPNSKSVGWAAGVLVTPSRTSCWQESRQCASNVGVSGMYFEWASSFIGTDSDGDDLHDDHDINSRTEARAIFSRDGSCSRS